MTFEQIDLIIVEVDLLVKGGDVTPLVASRMAGLISVMAVAAFEMRIKELLVSFSTKRDLVFGTFVSQHYGKLNGRIKIEHLKGDSLTKFGNSFKEKFTNELSKLSKDAQLNNLPDPAVYYDNLIVRRHDFVHELKTEISYEEAKIFYSSGVAIIEAFEKALTL